MILVRGGHVVTGDEDGHEWPRADVLIDDGRIAAIGPDAGGNGAAAADTEVIDASGSIVMPGLVNAHLHSAEAFQQGAFDNLPLEVWLPRCYPLFALPDLGFRDHYLRAMATAIQSIRAGVTAIQDDLVYPLGMPKPMDAAMQAYADAGLRAWVTVSMWDLPLHQCLPYMDKLIPSDIHAEICDIPTASARQQLDLFHAQYRRWHGHAGRLRVILGPCGPQRCTRDLLAEVVRLSDELDLPIHSHTLETRLQAVQSEEDFGKSLIAYMDEVGLLGPRMTLVHGIWLTERDIALLGERGCAVVHNPLSNMKLGSGLCPLRKLLDAGVSVALGTDGLSSSDTADLIEAIRTASLIHKTGTHDFENWVSAAEVFRMATIGGARSSLMDDELGSLEVGKRADLILLDRDHWGFIPLNDPVAQLAYSVTSEAVKTVLVGGQVVMRDRRMVSLDEDALKAEIAESAARFQRDHGPAMQAAADRTDPYMRAIYFESQSCPLATDG